MNLIFLLPLAVVVFVLVYVVGVYNSLVALKNRIKASVQEIGNQLKRQVELIPNLEESTKAFLKHEKDVFKLLTDARKAVSSAVESGNLTEMSKASDAVSQLLPRLQVVMESNPQIQSAGVVTKLMDELRDTSDKVMYSRRTLIDLTADYNIQLETFPTNLVAKLFSFSKESGLMTPVSGEHLTVSERELTSPKVKLN